MPFAAALLAWLAWLALDSAAAATADETLADVARYGVQLAEYDAAAATASDALQAAGADGSRLAQFVAHQDGTGRWRVSFGRIEGTGPEERFVEVYLAEPKHEGYAIRSRRETDPPSAPDLLPRARAILTAAAAFEADRRPYNTAVLPRADGTWFVYVYPAATSAAVWPLGGDERFLVDAGGHRIVARRRLHRTVLELDSGTMRRNGAVLAMHTHVTEPCGPAETDVLAARQTQLGLPIVVVCASTMFQVAPSGAITTVERPAE